MILILGLGNPGQKYEQNRHNAGFMFVDYMAHKYETTFTHDKYFNAEIAKFETSTNEIILAKPQTFMNRSGESLKQIVIRHSILPNDVYVAHDDLDIKLGEYKNSLGKGPKMHNGIRSIEDQWKTEAFWRIRIGIDNRDAPIPGETYVLSDFKEDELRLLQESFLQIHTLLENNKIM